VRVLDRALAPFLSPGRRLAPPCAGPGFLCATWHVPCCVCHREGRLSPALTPAGLASGMALARPFPCAHLHTRLHTLVTCARPCSHAHMTHREVSISEAARVLGVSRRTVHRRIQAGELVTTSAQDGAQGKVRVLLPDSEVETAQAHMCASRDNAQEVLQLRTEVALLRQERDWLRTLTEDLTRAVCVLESQRTVLPAPSTPERTLEPVRVPWWRRWLSWGVHAPVR
jgi:excisionase family DNA binding protein